MSAVAQAATDTTIDVQDLGERLRRLEDRVATIGEEEDGSTYQVLAAQQFQLYNERGEMAGMWGA